MLWTSKGRVMLRDDGFGEAVQPWFNLGSRSRTAEKSKAYDAFHKLFWKQPRRNSAKTGAICEGCCGCWIAAANCRIEGEVGAESSWKMLTIINVFWVIVNTQWIETYRFFVKPLENHIFVNLLICFFLFGGWVLSFTIWGPWCVTSRHVPWYPQVAFWGVKMFQHVGGMAEMREPPAKFMWTYFPVMLWSVEICVKSFCNYASGCLRPIFWNKHSTICTYIYIYIYIYWFVDSSSSIICVNRFLFVWGIIEFLAISKMTSLVVFWDFFRNMKKGDEASQALLGIDGLGAPSCTGWSPRCWCQTLECLESLPPNTLWVSRPFRGSKTPLEIHWENITLASLGHIIWKFFFLNGSSFSMEPLAAGLSGFFAPLIGVTV